MDEDLSVFGGATADMDGGNDLGSRVDVGPEPALALLLPNIDSSFIHLQISDNQVMEDGIMEQAGMMTRPIQPTL